MSDVSTRDRDAVIPVTDEDARARVELEWRRTMRRLNGQLVPGDDRAH